jgi:hypothetical protein
MNPLLFADIDPDSDEAWESFTLQNGIAHQTVYEAIMARDLVPVYTPLFDFPREDNQDYLLDHWRVHQSNALLLGIALPYDLSSADFSDPGQFSDWNAQHAIIHLNENRALGIV